MTKLSFHEYVPILESMLDRDQEAIKKYKAKSISSGDLRGVNEENIKIVKEVIDKVGFPVISLTSKKAYSATILVVLHSGDLNLIDQVTTFLHKASSSDIQKRDIAFLVDKSRVARNLPQLYGTQYKIDENRNIKYVDIEDLAGLDKRREELGMESFSEYKNIVQKNILPSSL